MISCPPYTIVVVSSHFCAIIITIIYLDLQVLAHYTVCNTNATNRRCWPGNSHLGSAAHLKGLVLRHVEICPELTVVGLARQMAPFLAPRDASIALLLGTIASSYCLLV
jgi:hypothetical protein